MSRARLMHVIFEQLPAGIPDEEAFAATERTLLDLLDHLETASNDRLALHLTGITLERMITRQCPVLPRLRPAISRGQLELLGGGHTAPILTLLPEREVVAQLQRTSNRVRAVIGREPAGAWIAGPVWDPSLAPLLAHQRVLYTFLDKPQLEYGFSKATGHHGIWTIERHGFRLPVVAVDPELAGLLREVGPPALMERLETYVAAEGILTLAEPIEAYAKGPAHLDRWKALVTLREEAAPWLEMHLPGTLVGTVAPRRVTWLPTMLPEAMASRATVPALQRATQSPALDLPLPFEHLFARYPELNRLHKRMLLTSSRLQRLARVIQERHASGEAVETLNRALERAVTAVLEAQTQAAWWPGPSGGCYRPDLRGAAWRRLIEAQRLADATFYPEPRWVAIEQIDLEGTGLPDLLMASPKLELTLRLTGGALIELHYKPRPRALIDLFGRRPELEHDRLRVAGVGEPGRHDGLRQPPRSERETSLEPRLRYDRYSRHGLLDHFLGPAATPDNFYACQYPEVGDYLDGVYEVIRAEYDRREARGVVHLARNGFVEEGGRRSPVRVEKIVELEDRDARLRVRYVLTNRSLEPVRFRFGPELGFAVPLRLSRLACGLVDPALSDATLDWEALDDDRGARSGVRGLELDGDEAGLRVVISLDQPADLWWFALETLACESDEITLRTQGSIFLPWWDISLWGDERRELVIDLEITEPIEAPETTIEDETDA